jgi:(1->4)-alpha-D-glucan 1-alpha-D-glucosylmutase
MAADVPFPPRATYRLQFSTEFRLEDARRIVPYLAALGISHVYASPLLAARPGSTHGYDIVDHGRLNPEIGDEAELEALAEALRAHGMGLILDFVPNHMGIGPDNPWWMDVLEWGRASPFAGFFDIDWSSPEPSLAGKVLLPVLGDQYGAVLERGELELRFDARAGTFVLGYFDATFPIAPRDYPLLLHAAALRAGAAAEAVAALAEDLLAATRGGRGRLPAGARRKRVDELKQRLAALAQRDATLPRAVGEVLEPLNGRRGEPASFDALHRLLERQSYRLAYWRVAAHEINYRRFFDVNDLAGLRMEQPELFAASHELVARWLAERKVHGLRLDHVDGLRDSKRYFERLQQLAPGPPGAGATTPRLYVLVEKILAGHERLRADWPVAGTTGYEFMADVNGLFVDPAAEIPLTRTYERIAGTPFHFEEAVVAAKYQVIRESLASELNVLAAAFNRLAKQSRASRDFSLLGFREALVDVVAHFPVYRTYVSERGPSDDDRRDIDWAIGKARRAARTPDTSIYDFIHAVLTLDLLRENRGWRRRDVIDAMLKFQQYTGPVMAKSMEDTVFYRVARLASLNEVGGDPGKFGTSVKAFHEVNRRRLAAHPYSLLATATHDHKRGEDMRARLNVISEVPREWSRRVRRWMHFNARKHGEADGTPAPTRRDEYFFYQALVGAWPYAVAPPGYAGIEEYAARLDAYMLKAAREAKQHTSWAAPNAEYESALSEFVRRCLEPSLSGPFLDDVCAFVDAIAPAGAVNGLAQVLLKLASPGVPDVYQGTELWDLSLVDPDNRGPVDYALRERSLSGGAADDLLRSWRDGRVKQHLIRCALALRSERPELFAAGDYVPLEAEGPHAERVVAFARTRDDAVLVAVAPPHVLPQLTRGEPLPAGWGSTRLVLAAGALRARAFVDVLTAGEVAPEADGGLPLERCLARCPVALLASV